jgi:tetratricopeptide (TPR) repeat protein
MSDQSSKPRISVAQVKKSALLDLVADGQRALGQGRAEDALRLSESILESDAELTQALALKGDALERLGRIDEALETYEKVVKLSPDSPLDQIRVNHLKKLAAAENLVEPQAPKQSRSAVLAAAAAFVLVTSAGAAVWITSQSRPVEQSAAQPELPEAVNFSVAPVPTSTGGGFTDAYNSQPPTGELGSGDTGFDSAQPDIPAGNGSAPITTLQGTTGSSSQVPDSGNGFVPAPVVLPGAGSLPNLNAAGVQPNTNAAGSGATNQGFATIDPEPLETSGGDQASRRPPGIIDIRPSEDQSEAGSSTSSSAGTASDSNEDKLRVTTLISVAQNHYLKGDFAKAAAAYEEALRAGSSPGSTNQRLAQCYEKLGQKEKAITAYNRAIANYRASKASGAKNPDLIDRSIAVCEQAVKVLKGA